MSEKKPMPKCPYCGAEMRLEDNEDVLFGLFSDEEKCTGINAVRRRVASTALRIIRKPVLTKQP